MSIRLIRGRASASVAFSDCQRTRRPNMLRHPKENLSTSEGDKIAQTPLGGDRSLRRRSAYSWSVRPGTSVPFSSAARTQTPQGFGLCSCAARIPKRTGSRCEPPRGVPAACRCEITGAPGATRCVTTGAPGATRCVTTGAPGATRCVTTGAYSASRRPLVPGITPRRRFAGYASSTVLCHV